MIDAKLLSAAIERIEESSFRTSLLPDLDLIVSAASAHLETLPKTKEVDVWHCQWVSRSGGGDHLHLNVYPTEGGARDHAEFLEAGGNKSSSALHCVQVTGPHKMTVLA